jgi:hypothetical protein
VCWGVLCLSINRKATGQAVRGTHAVRYCPYDQGKLVEMYTELAVTALAELNKRLWEREDWVDLKWHIRHGCNGLLVFFCIWRERRSG